MNTRDQFGNYLLLKRLGEDALGETFRAGKIGPQALERVVLLRVLNGQGFDADRIARALQARAGLGQALKSANIAQAIDVGQVRGVPFSAYEYSSGRSLGQLLEQAARRNSPLPLDHALLVAERVALALAVAFETRFGDDRVQHGFLAPALIHVSNEGELKLQGFETSAGLRESAAHPLVKQAVGRYLAPETVAGEPASKADDIYSLGAILFEMITGQQVPMMPAGGFGAALDQMTSAADGAAPPAELIALLKRTLCPREQRVPDAVTWHKTLAKLMADSGLVATTFNLAFFLHSLFRDEIDRDGRELETEKSQAEAMIAAAAPAAEPAPTEPIPVRASGPVREDTAVLRDAYGLPPKKTGGSGILIGAGAGAVAILAVVGWFVLGRGGPETPVSEPQAQPQVAAPAPVEPEPEPVAAAPAGPTPEEIQAQIAEMVTQQSKQLQAGIQAQYDEQLKSLQRQLDDAQKAREATPPPAPARIESLQGDAGTNSVQRAAQPELQPAAAAPQPGSQSPPAQQGAATANRPPATSPRPAPQPAAKAPVRPTPTAAPKLPEAGGVKQGDLVTPGPGVVTPRVLRAPSPSYPALAKRMKREATVTVRVLVDENGRPAQTEIVGKKAGFGLDEAALDYARGCIFEPAKKNGIKVRMWYDLQVAFTLGGG